MTDFKAVMAEIHAANSEFGVNVRGGKKYLEVAKRVEIFRKHFGLELAISTEIVHLGMVKGEPVVVRAIISQDGRVVATGTAGEVVGSSNVNNASALENAETSAIGRALATLGLHGGEFASLNEMAAIGTKPENPTAQGLVDAWEQAIMDTLQDDPSPETLADAYADQMETDIDRYKTNSGIDGYLAKHKGHLRFIEEHAPERYSEIRAAVLAKRATLEKAA